MRPLGRPTGPKDNNLSIQQAGQVLPELLQMNFRMDTVNTALQGKILKKNLDLHRCLQYKEEYKLQIR